MKNPKSHETNELDAVEERKDENLHIAEEFIVIVIINQSLLLGLPLLVFAMVFAGIIHWPAGTFHGATYTVAENTFYISDIDSISFQYKVIGGMAVFWSWCSIVFFSAGFVHLGICFSALRTNSPHRNLVTKFKKKAKIVPLMLFVALSTGCFIVLLFAGGFIQGSLFPVMETDKYFDVLELIEKPEFWGKLGVWCAIIGYFDRILPTLAKRLSRAITEVGKP